MVSLGTIEKALDRAERRTLMRAYKALKPLKENILKAVLAGGYEFYDISQLAGAFKIGMLSAYIYGRASLIGYIQGKMKERVEKIKLEDDYIVQMIMFIMRSDKLLMQSLMSRKIDPMQYYFRPSEKVLRFLDEYTVQLAHVIQEDLLENMTQWVRETIQQGMSEKEAIKYLQSKVKVFSRNRLQKIARTEATRAFNIGTLEEGRESDIVVGYRFDAVLDKNTTDICRARNGKFIPKGMEDLLIENTPPLHVNCRSRLVPVTELDSTKNLPMMPEGWEDDLRPQKRPYDIAVLRQVLVRGVDDFTLRSRRLQTDMWIDQIKDTVSKMRIIGDRYTVAELKEVYKGLDYKFDPPPIMRNPPDDISYYDFMKDEIAIAGQDALSSAQAMLHESLHRVRFLKTGNTVPIEIEEATNDIVVKYLLTKYKGMSSPFQGYSNADFRFAYLLRSKYEMPSEACEALLRWRLSDGRMEGLRQVISVNALDVMNDLTGLESKVIEAIKWANHPKRKKAFRGIIKTKLSIIAERQGWPISVLREEVEGTYEIADDIAKGVQDVRLGYPRVRLLVESLLELMFKLDRWAW